MNASDLLPTDYYECLIIFWLTLLILVLTLLFSFS